MEQVENKWLSEPLLSIERTDATVVSSSTLKLTAEHRKLKKKAGESAPHRESVSERERAREKERECEREGVCEQASKSVEDPAASRSDGGVKFEAREGAQHTLHTIPPVCWWLSVCASIIKLKYETP